MKVLTTRPFEADYAALPEQIRRLVDHKLKLFLQNPRHPSLQAKKMLDPREIWECRITRSYRFTFQLEGGVCILRRVGTHDILRTP